MDQKRHLCHSVLLSGALALQPCLAVADARSDPVSLFASCTGRLSAVMEFQWLIQDRRAEETQMQRDALAEVLASATPKGDEARAMGMRVQAKEAQRQILMLTLQRDNPARANWARRRAIALLTECRALMIS